MTTSFRRYTVRLTHEDDRLESTVAAVAYALPAMSRREAQDKALRRANADTMGNGVDGAKYVTRLHDEEWDKDGSMTRVEHRKLIEQLMDLHEMRR